MTLQKALFSIILLFNYGWTSYKLIISKKLNWYEMNALKFIDYNTIKF